MFQKRKTPTLPSDQRSPSILPTLKASKAQIQPRVEEPLSGANPIEGGKAGTTISVVIAGRNPGVYVAEMLDSLVGQIDPADEIVYYDDASDDASLNIVHGYREKLPQLRVFSGNRRLGVSAARNRANALATCEYIAVLDSDDLFHRDAVLLYRQMISMDRSIDFVYADTIVFNHSTGNRKRRRYPTFTRSRHPIASLMASPVLPFKHSSVIYRRSKIMEIGGYHEDLRIKVDFEMFIRIIRQGGRIAKLDQVTSFHRIHAGQMSRERLKGIGSYWKIIEFHEPRLIQSLIYKLLRGAGEVAKILAGR